MDKPIDYVLKRFRCKLVSQAYADCAAPRDATEADLIAALQANDELRAKVLESLGLAPFYEEGRRIAELQAELERASAATEERTKSVDDDCPPGGRRVDVYLSGDRQTLAFPGGAFTTVRACRHCGVLITGGPTACVHCVALAEAAESKGAKT